MVKVKKRVLLFIAGIIWLAAGVNIARIGVLAVISLWNPDALWRNVGILALAALIFVGFSFMFYRIVQKNERRILGYEGERVSVFRFFDVKGYLLMAFMMTLGIVLRGFQLLPDFFFAFFYTGLGSALSLSGLRFLVRGFRLTLRQVIWLTVGAVAFSLGTLGIFLPILPTVPLYLLTAVALLSSSQRLYLKFKESRLYQRFLKPYLDAGGLTRKVKLCLIVFVTLQIALAAFLVRNSLVGLILLGVLYAGFLLSMAIFVKTIPPKSNS